MVVAFDRKILLPTFYKVCTGFHKSSKIQYLFSYIRIQFSMNFSLAFYFLVSRLLFYIYILFYFTLFYHICTPCPHLSVMICQRLQTGKWPAIKFVIFWSNFDQKIPLKQKLIVVLATDSSAAFIHTGLLFRFHISSSISSRQKECSSFSLVDKLRKWEEQWLRKLVFGQKKKRNKEEKKNRERRNALT